MSISKSLETSDLRVKTEPSHRVIVMYCNLVDITVCEREDVWTDAHMVNLVEKVSASPLRALRVLASGVATMFSAPARIMRKK